MKVSFHAKYRDFIKPAGMTGTTHPGDSDISSTTSLSSRANPVFYAATWRCGKYVMLTYAWMHGWMDGWKNIPKAIIPKRKYIYPTKTRSFRRIPILYRNIL